MTHADDKHSFEALLDDLLRRSQLTWSPDAPAAVKEKIAGDWLADNDNRVLIVARTRAARGAMPQLVS